MVMVCRMCEQQPMTQLLRQVSKSILSEGGVVRGFTNLGDRVLVRNQTSEDNVHHNVGRFMQVEFYASPQTKNIAELTARDSGEVLRLFTLKVKEDDYFKRIMGQVNSELSPFKDEETRDSLFMREMLDHYRKTEDFKDSTSDRQVERNDKSVHAYLKQMEVKSSGDEDLKTLQSLQEGEIRRDHEKVQEYLVRRLQNMPKAM